MTRFDLVLGFVAAVCGGLVAASGFALGWRERGRAERKRRSHR